MMSNILKNNYLRFVILAGRCLASTGNNVNIGDQMKILNDNKQYKKVLELFDAFNENNIDKCSNWIVIQALKACTQINDVQHGLKIHNLISSRLKHDPYVLPSLIHFYMQCGDINRAQLLFETSTKKTLPMYGAMMKGYIKNNLPKKVIDLFNEIKDPDRVIIILLFNACAQLGTNEELNLCGDVTSAKSLFDRSSKKTISMYGAMMKGFIINNLSQQAIDLFNEIKDPNETIITLFFNACAQLGTEKELILLKSISSKISNSFYSNPYVVTSLIDAFMKCGDVTSAKALFDRSTKKALSMYGAMMKGLTINDQEEEAIGMFNEIHLDELHRENHSGKQKKLLSEMNTDRFEANIIVYLCLLKALTKLGMLEKAQSFVQQIPGYFLTDHRIGSALIHMWGKVGSVDKAKRIFDKISQPDHIGWTAMINSYGLNGMGDEAVKLFHQMPKESIDHLTYICVLNACSHSGLVDVARSIFNNIQTKTEIIYTTMIDCLSRAAAFEEAQKLIGEFERDHAPAVSVYMPLLSGARNQKYSKLSQEVVDRMQKLFPNMKDSLVAASILLANVYASSGDIGKATDIKIELHKSGAKKRIGVTVTDIDGKLWKFRAHDRSHAESAEIHEQVDRMSKRIIEHGHKYDASWIVRPMEPDETIETLLCGHSERLAMAAHFIRNRKPKRIQMTKNLRICGDCHEVTKLVALIYQCEIVVRDANRIHHFHLNGQCSCQDYF
ncbi:unnamed protein product [Rotaria magnacalcarata]|uniref:DYW domain-containing protein n=1 Tax=Rotaria magnacalcarata TaxID=392030 RepID=A0A818YYT0_9BILA|nr:unnamed protein product [Rotaria magnacalcarata]CAF2021491.1 unnamed protein product [Rotaria magnacalcarata]CAF3762155.1 unnamed protein product [Rotaria magnacalcarata]